METNERNVPTLAALEGKGEEWLKGPSGYEYRVRTLTVADFSEIVGSIPDLNAFVSSKPGRERDLGKFSAHVDRLCASVCLEPAIVLDGAARDGAIPVRLIPAADRMMIYNTALRMAGFTQERAEAIRPL